MKTLLILAVILGILFLYFIVKAEKSFVIKGNEVVPGGINIPKLILDKIGGGIKPQILGNDAINNAVGSSGLGFINNITTDAKDFVSKTIDKINESIKSPIENKINEILCPTK